MFGTVVAPAQGCLQPTDSPGSSPAPPLLAFNDLSLPVAVLKAPDNSQMKLITHTPKGK